jgi:hypothetical protein
MQYSVTPHLVDVDGKTISIGDSLTDFRGEAWRVDGIELPRHAGSTGRVVVSKPCRGCDGPGEHHFWCGLRQVREFFPSVFELTWVQPLAQQS